VKALFILGPTASGKTAVALHLAARLPVEIVSVDSAQVYRGMDVGTAKPDAATLARFPHHLVDIVEPTEAYSAGRFRADALRLAGEIHGRGRVPLFVGGTMLYYRALVRGLADLPVADPAVRGSIEARAREHGWPALHRELARIDPGTAARLEPTDAQRIQRALEVHAVSGRTLSAWHAQAPARPAPFESLVVSLEPSDRAVLHERIARRFESMVASGLVDELRALRARHRLDASMPSMRSVGYRQAWEAIEGRLPMAALASKGTAATRQLAKRQLTWLRAMPEARRADCLEDGVEAAVARWAAGFLGG
jgi:tRNA dimethylallyltransferase